MVDIKRPVFMCGENPDLRLCVPNTEQLVTAVATLMPRSLGSPWASGGVLVNEHANWL